MTSGLSCSLAQAKQTLRTEGLATLLRHSLEAYVFHSGQYYLYVNEDCVSKEVNEAAMLPRIEGVTFKTIHSNSEADELAGSTGYDFREHFLNARDRLDKGAVAFCAFVNGEIAAIS